MNLVVRRKWFTDESTVGELSINGNFECFTLEDVVRDGPKIDGQTAIPAGTYRVVVDWSNRFERLMPHILDVPDFKGIRIHSGNTDKDTEGCILLGKLHGADVILNSREAFAEFFKKLPIRVSYEDLPVTKPSGGTGMERRPVAGMIEPVEIEIVNDRDWHKEPNVTP